MSERPSLSQIPTTPKAFPEELVGAYSNWKQKKDPSKDSTHQTRLIDAQTGKSKVISRAAFKERFEESPTTEYWTAGSITTSDASRIPFTPTEMQASAEKVVAKTEKSGLRRKIGKFIGRTLIAGTLFGATFASAGDHTANPIPADSDPAPTEINVETPVVLPAEPTFEIDPEPRSTETITPASSAAPEATPTATPSVEETSDATGEGDSVETEKPAESPTSPSIVPGTPETPQSVVTPTASATEQADDATQQPAIIEPESAEFVEPTTPVAEDTAQQSEPTVSPETSESEQYILAIDLLSEVEVQPGDGVTHLLGRILEGAGYTDITPAQLFTLYEELITNPEIGPDNIFVGVDLYYDDATDTYGVAQTTGRAHLTDAAAEWIQRNGVSSGE